jgi:DNA-binding protein YbaB
MTFIVFDQLPSAASLQPALTTLDQQLNGLDALLRGKTYAAASANQNLKAVVSGAMEVVSITIAAAAVNAANPGALGPALLPVVNQALGAAQAQTPSDVSSAVSAMSLLGLCAPSAAFPNFAGFPEAAAVLTAEKPVLDGRVAARQFQGQSGDVTATVSGQLQLVALSVTRIPSALSLLETDVKRAINLALDAAAGLTDATIAQQIGALDANTVTYAAVCLYARGKLQLADRVVVKDAAGAGAPIANAGNNGTTLGLNARAGNVWSWAKVTLQSSSRVDGFVKTAQTYAAAGSPVVTGGVSQGAFFVLPELSLVPTFPSSNQGSITVANGQTRTLAPGNYDSVTVNSGGTLKLSAGTYLVNICDLQPGGTTLVDSAAGRVVFHVRGLLKISHAVKSAGSAPPNLLMGSYGLEIVRVAAPFKGTLIAPGAEINLSPANAHAGAFFGKDITTAADTTITFVPYTGTPLFGTF